MERPKPPEPEIVDVRSRAVFEDADQLVFRFCSKPGRPSKRSRAAERQGDCTRAHPQISFGLPPALSQPPALRWHWRTLFQNKFIGCEAAHTSFLRIGEFYWVR